MRLADAGPQAASALYNRQRSAGAEPVDYAALTAEFEKTGSGGLANGLSPEENEQLFTTTHLPEMIALVLRGLSRLGASSHNEP